MVRIPFILLAIVVAILPTSQVSGQHVILGVLEDSPSSHYGDPNSRKVRIVFEKNDTEWTDLLVSCADEHCLKEPSKYPRQIDWTVALDGKNVGRVTARIPDGWRLYGNALQEIVSTGPIPTIGQKTNACIDAMVYRPLVANSQPYFKDPESWKPFRLPADTIASVRLAFRKEFPKMCRQDKHDEAKLERFPYLDGDIADVKAYRSNKGWTLVRLHLPEAIDCQDTERGFEITDKWFTIDPSRSVRYLGDGMSLVDAGDYDNDGRSEVMFCINDDNRGGYRLFYDNFKKHAELEYSYH